MLKGYTLIIQAMLLVLEENDLERGELLIEQGFPPGTPPDFRVSMLGIAHGIINAERRDLDAMIDQLQGVGQLFTAWLGARIGLTVSALMPIAIVIEAQRGNHRRAVEILSARLKHPYGNWVKHWRLLDEIQVELRTTLGDAAYEAAWETGQHVELEPFCREIIKEIVAL